MKGGFRVRGKQCATCIYHPTSPLNLQKLEDDVKDDFLEGHFKGHRICHSPVNGEDVCCRGFWNRHKDHFDVGQLAQRLNAVVFVHEQKETEEPMSNKHSVKRAKREAKRSGAKFTGRPAYHFHSRYAGMTAEEIERAVAQANGRLEPKRSARPSALPAPRAEAQNIAAARVQLPAHKAQQRYELAPDPEGEIQEGSLRAAVVDALKAGRGSMTLEELSKLLKRDARPVVAKLAQKGWLRQIEN